MLREHPGPTARGSPFYVVRQAAADVRPAYDRKAAFQTVSEVVPVRVKPSSFAAGVFADAGEYGMDRRVIFAKARNDLVLPVIDLSNPRFAVPDDPASLEAQREAFITWYRNQQRMPRFIMRLFLRRAAKRSQLAQAVFQSDKGFLDSISTYVLKLGVENLPRGFDGPIDKRIAGAPHAVFIRLRMQQIAKLLADALVEPLSADAAAPLHLINIAGGPALDSINAIILLKRTRPDLLKRRIDIEVLDSQTDGPAFGANALAALKQADGPLHGLAVEFDHRPYDWNDPAVLVEIVAKSRAGGAIVAASSEGGLFEYGSDEAIVANLRGLSGGGVSLVAGSVTSASDIRKRMIAETNFKLFPRGLEGLAPLAAQGGYDIRRSEPAIVSDQVLLRMR